jgi:ABC-type nitrate/sulfonate/bicarbonate transport system substrate-binding protein
MDKGEGIMPVPQGVISTSEGPVDPEVVQEVVQVLDEAIAEADKEEAVEEYDNWHNPDDLL